jgi:hypothetical protein
MVIEGAHYILTASHVWDKVLKDADHVGITLRPHTNHRFSIAVIKLLLPGAIHQDVQLDLWNMNVNAATSFPGLDGLARSLNYHLRIENLWDVKFDSGGFGPTGFDFVGYDLADIQGSTSALTNCGGFPEIFSNSELSEKGLLSSFVRAKQVQDDLRRLNPQEIHAHCHLWAIFRAM